MKTTIHAYRFDLRIPAEKAAWKELRARLVASHPHCMESHTGHRKDSHYRSEWNGLEIELDTKNLFDNQWNADINGVGTRVFDWALDTEWTVNRLPIKQGYYLEQSEEMRAIRRETLQCGYCGKYQPIVTSHVFCPHCLGSEYLKESDLKLTRLVSVASRFGFEYPELTETERAERLPMFRHAQIYGQTERERATIAKERDELKAKRDAAIAAANIEYDSQIWLMDHGISRKNCIYYSHKNEFCFGWRDKGLDKETAAHLRAALKGFPGAYTIVERA